MTNFKNIIMKKLLLFFTLFLMLFSSCSDDSITKEEPSSLNTTRAAIEQRNFEWEKLKFIEFKDNLNRTRKIPAPWIAGSGLNLGVPRQFQDFNFSESSSENLYSTKNGWRLLYHNLDLTGDPYKYLVLYNRYTGILRAFFLSLASSNSVVNTNSTFIGFQVTGSSSLLNYTSSISYDVSKKFNNSVFISSPTKAFNMPTTVAGKPINISDFGVGYENERWYAAEMELSYDPGLSSSNTLDIQITAAQTSLSYTSGTFGGKIEGSIITKAANPSSISLNLGQSTTNTVTINTNGEDSKNVLEADTKSQSFLDKLKSNASKWISDAFNKSGKELINGIFSKGSGAIVDAFGSLMNSFTGLGGASVQESKVDLSFNGSIELKTTTFVPTNGWGQIVGLPTTGQNQLKLYSGKLGVWSLSETPKFSASFQVVGIYQTRDPYGQIVAVNSKAWFYLTNNPTIVLNPDLAAEYTVKDLKTAVCFADNDMKKNTPIYGKTNGTEVYSMNYHVSPDVSMAGNYTKNNFVSQAKFTTSSLYAGCYNLPLYYHVTFKLQPKNSSGKEVYFSRYVKAELDKNNGSVSLSIEGV